MLGLSTAVEELALVLFTTLAPSGAIAFIFMGVISLSRKPDDTQRTSISRALALPILFALIGLVASAAHLGNPENALYVFTNIGGSPLSNEVLYAVIFLGLASIYWLYAFAKHPIRLLQDILMVLAIIFGIVFVTSVAFAYDVDTIITWHTVYSPLNLWLNALVGGPMLAMLGLRIARFVAVERRFGMVLLLISAIALCVNLVVYGLQSAYLSDISNSLVVASDLVPLYIPSIILFGVLGCISIILNAWVMRRYNQEDTHASRRSVLVLSSLSCFFVLLGIFVMRFSFYMMHMTVGLSV
ncbi:MAG: dimethyl sulfoxide reductase anchor subunit [Coriobacteriaceae bacterium]|nr:dimethyl sulfoxide reductase anchor subunit [Coriobacteriaceae bacterium]